MQYLIAGKIQAKLKIDFNIEIDNPCIIAITKDNTMFIYTEGNKSKGPCEKCQKLVSTTFRYAPLNYNGLVIPEILQDFCDECGDAVSIPHQSSYRIREFKQR
jgi:hypothetical protein